MVLSSAEINTAQNRGKIKIAGYSSGCLTMNAYRLRVGNTIERYTNDQAAFDAIHLDDGPPIIEDIGAQYVLVPGAVYIIHARETSVSGSLDAFLSSTKSAAKCGLQVIGSCMAISGELKIAVSVVQPIIIQPDQFFAQLQFHKDCDHTMTL